MLTQAGKPPKPGGGSMTNPALVYVETDAVITIATADGQAVQRLTGGTEGWSVSRGAPVWSPDGTKIAYVEDRDDDSSPYPALYVMNADGSNRTLAYGFAGYPTEYSALTWLPGGFMHFTMNRDARFLDLADGSVQSLGLGLFHATGTYIGPTAVGPGVDPSTAGARGLVAYAALEPGVSEDSDIHIAEVVTDFDGSLLLDPTTITRLALPGNQNFAVISPDGLQIVFYDETGIGSGHTLAVVDLLYDDNGADFGTVRVLRQGDFWLSPTWSPDSQWIAFTWVPQPENKRFGADFEIAKIRRDGTEFTNVTNSGQHQIAPNWNPAWDPAK